MYKQFNNTNNSNHTNNSVVEYKYICIKKDFFDVNMVYLNHNKFNQCGNIDIIYKSPSLILE